MDNELLEIVKSLDGYNDNGFSVVSAKQTEDGSWLLKVVKKEKQEAAEK